MDNYRLTHLLGHGDFAEVYLGMHRHSGTQAAVKLWQAPLANASEIETFREEAQTIATLQHPHILRVLEFGVAGGHPYLVMEYAPGGSLRKLHPAGTEAPLVTVVSYVQQITQALRFAHDQQLIHRNLKPSNLLVGRGGAILLSDFGLSMGYARARQSLALAGAYTAPEQWQGHPLPASDQYALGVIVYEWLTGQLPITGALQKVSANHPVAVPPPALGPLPSLPAVVEQVMMIALAKDPKERFANVSAFARALEQASQTVERPFPAVPPPPGIFPPRAPVASIQVPPPAAPGIPLPPTGHPSAEARSSPAETKARAMEVGRRPPSAPPMAPPPTFLPSPTPAPAAPLPTDLSPRRRRRPLLWALVAGLLLLVLGGGSLVGWGLTGHGPLAAGGRNTATPHPSVTITEFVLPQHASVPDGITLGPDGNLWFTEVDVGKIGRISPNGSITQFSLPVFYLTPSGITAGPDGNLWFVESSGNRIGWITPTGRINEFALSKPDRFPLSITAGPDDNLWFTESMYQNLIGRITPTGRITEFAVPTNAAPGAITTGPDHNLWFTDAGTNQIGRITPSGTITEFAVPTAKSAPVWITVGPDSNLWFTEYTGNKIGRITPAGAITEFAVPTTKSRPDGITAGPDGALWFTESDGNQIGRLTVRR